MERPRDFIASRAENRQIDTRLRICFAPIQVVQGLSFFESEAFGPSHWAVGRHC